MVTMPDIDMCAGKDCPSRGECFRYMATPRIGIQKWREFDQHRRDEGGCVAFMKIRNWPPRDEEVPVAPI
ncbi:MAG: hypothetical protein H8E94_09450 [Alphaproteobacteria bacterium]|nr:hypothetical protein [Alphaproteobacteria bacterium]